MPFTVLREVDMQVALPDWKINTIKNLGYGSNSKMFIGVNERVWRKQGYAGYAFSDNGMMNGYDHTQMQNNNTGPAATPFSAARQVLRLAIWINDARLKYVRALDGVFPVWRRNSTITFNSGTGRVMYFQKPVMYRIK